MILTFVRILKINPFMMVVFIKLWSSTRNNIYSSNEIDERYMNYIVQEEYQIKI